VAVLVLSSCAISRQDLPSWRRDSILERLTKTLGRPSRLPLFLAVAIPARTGFGSPDALMLGDGGDDRDHGVSENAATVEILPC